MGASMRRNGRNRNFFRVRCLKYGPLILASPVSPASVRAPIGRNVTEHGQSDDVS